jgi:LmbE family N-acetylglucosaminyl deacetylase
VKVLVVAAHPDDVELLCAGTLGLLRRAGHELWLAHMTVGDKGGQQPPDELARIRGGEAARAADVLGAQTFGGICGDLELYPCEPHARRIGEILTEVEPDVVITHALNDYHPDHRVTGLLVVERVGAAGLGQLSVLYMDTVAGIDFVPEFYCDVTETVELKKEMLRCHTSQIQWMATYRHTDMEYLIEWIGRWRGLQCGARYAEGFQRETRFGRPERSQSLLETLSLVEAGAAG